MQRALSIFLAMILAVAAGFSSEYPDDAFPRPTNDRWPVFETVSGVEGLPGVVERSRLYDEYRMSGDDLDGHRGMRWVFLSKPGVPAAATLRFSESLRRMPERFTLKIRNNGSTPVQLAGSLGEVGWQPQPQRPPQTAVGVWDKVIPPGGSDTVELSRKNLQIVPGGGELLPPGSPCLLSMNIFIRDAKPATRYDVTLGDLCVHYPESPANVRVVFPAKIPAGSPYFLEIEGRDIPASAVIDVIFRKGRWVCHRERLNRDEVDILVGKGRLSLTKNVPWYLPSGEFEAVVAVDGLLAGTATAFQVENSRTGELPKTERRLFNGVPTAFLNGKPLLWNGYASYDWSPGNVTAFGRAGANMFFIPTNAGRHVHNVSRPTWTSPATHDYGELDEQVCLALSANKDAYVMIRLYLSLPQFWLDQHPDAKARIRAGGDDLVWEESGGVVPSLSSAEWRNEQDEQIKALVEYIRRQPWAGRVAGFMVSGGVTEEWFAWGANDGVYADYSPAALGAFAGWCKKRGLPFSEPPSPEARNPEGRDLHPDTAEGRLAAACAQFTSETVSDAISHFSATIKKAAGERGFVGTFAAYLIQLAGEPRQSLAGHGDVRSLLDDPNIDFLAGIPLHNFRSLPEGYDTYTGPTASVREAGKLYYNENDYFSWLHQGHWFKPYDPADPRAAAISIHRRCLATDLINGGERGKFSLFASWHNDPALMEEFARHVALQTESLNWDRSPNEEVALLVDDSSFAWLTPSSTLPRRTNADLLMRLARTGAPVTVWLLSDADKLPDRIRFVAVAFAPAPRAGDRAKLAALIAKGGRTILLVGPAGIIDSTSWKWNLDGPADLTGLPICIHDKTLDGSLDLAFDNRALFRGKPIRPYATLRQAGWARFPNPGLTPDGESAAGERPLGNSGRLLWAALPPLDSNLLREWIQSAGVHCYAPEGFFCHASRDLVSITAPHAGKVEIQFPSDVSAVNLFAKESFRGKSWIADFRTGETKLLKITRP